MIGAVTGGRRHWLTIAELERLELEIRDRHVTTIRNGQARGVDKTVHGYLADRGVCALDKWPANWKAHGDAAGPLRNVAMLEGDPEADGDRSRRVDVLFAFHGEAGTTHCRTAALGRGIDVVDLEPVVEPRVWNRHAGDPPGPWVYVGRGTPLGNPWRLSAAFGEARAVAAERILGNYRRHLWSLINRGHASTLAALDEITPEHFLVCSCWPRRCHAEIIVRAWRYRRRQA